MTRSHFLSLNDLSKQELFKVLDRADILKKEHQNNVAVKSLQQKVLAMIFEKSSTRTRVSFEAGMIQLGGTAIFLSSNDTQLGRGEPLEDTARVLSEMVHAVMIRTDSHDRLTRFAAASSIPVINGLSDSCHPCQLLADLQAIRSHFGTIEDLKIAWIGDGNNVCQSYIEAAGICGFDLTIAVPEGYDPDPVWLKLAGTRVKIVRDPVDAVRDAHVVTTDVWTSMGHEEEAKKRLAAFRKFQVTPDLLNLARDEVQFLHCLPAHRGEEISENLFDDSRAQIVWIQAGNRLHSQKALLEHLII